MKCPVCCLIKQQSALVGSKNGVRIPNNDQPYVRVTSMGPRATSLDDSYETEVACRLYGHRFNVSLKFQGVASSG